MSCGAERSTGNGAAGTSSARRAEGNPFVLSDDAVADGLFREPRSGNEEEQSEYGGRNDALDTILKMLAENFYVSATLPRASAT